MGNLRVRFDVEFFKRYLNIGLFDGYPLLGLLMSCGV